MRLALLALATALSLPANLLCSSSRPDLPGCDAFASLRPQDPPKKGGAQPGRYPPPVPVPPPNKPEQPQQQPEEAPPANVEREQTPEEKFAEDFKFINNFGEPTYASLVIVMGRDETTGDLGYALLSGLPAAGGIIVDAKADVGIVALAGRPKTLWRQEAMLLLEAGKSARETVEALTGSEQLRDFSANKSMLMVMDKDGNGAHFIGSGVLAAPDNTYVESTEGFMLGGCVLQPGARYDRILHGKFDETEGFPLPERLLLTLQAAVDAQKEGPLASPGNAVAAAMVVTRPGGGYDGTFDRLIDLRVDFNRDPIRELRGMYEVWGHAVMIPRLRAMLRRISDVQSEEYKRANRWLTRTRMRYKLGENK